MQSLHLDSHTKQDSNGRQLAAKKLATPRPLRAVQWTTRNSPSLLLRLVLGWEHFDVDLIRPQVQPSSIRVWWEEGAANTPRQRRRHVNGGGHLHNVEHLEGKKQKNLSECGHGCSTSGLQSQRGHLYAL